MPRYVAGHRSNKAGNVGEFFLRVIEPRNHERDNLDPYAHRVKRLDCPEHPVQSSAELLVILLTETLQVDFVQVNIRTEEFERLRGPVTVGHERAADAVRMGQRKYFCGPLTCDQRFVVRAREDWNAAPEGERDDITCTYNLDRGDGVGIPGVDDRIDSGRTLN